MIQLTRIHNKVLEIFDLDPKKTTPKGWLIGAKCPFCGSDEKFGIKLNSPKGEYTNHISYNCFRGSCQERGGEFLLFKQIGILDWYNQGSFVKHGVKLENKIKQKEECRNQVDLAVPKASKPLGFKRIYRDQYLEERGFEFWQFDLYTIGETSSFRKLRDYVIFLIEEDGVNKGYVARSKKSKVWIDEYNKQIKKLNKDLPKEERKRLYLRYINQPGVDFDRLLFGIDEIDEGTTTVILVEGITDKANVDRWLYNNDLEEDIVCLCTFGKKLSEAQRVKLIEKMFLDQFTIIFMYDPDAINDEKRHGHESTYYIDDVRVIFLKDKDPGDLSEKELDWHFFNAESIHSFIQNKVQKRKLR